MTWALIAKRTLLFVITVVSPYSKAPSSHPGLVNPLLKRAPSLDGFVTNSAQKLLTKDA